MALMATVPATKDTSLFHLCEFIEDCEFTELSTQVIGGRSTPHTHTHTHTHSPTHTHTHSHTHTHTLTHTHTHTHTHTLTHTHTFRPHSLTPHHHDASPPQILHLIGELGPTTASPARYIRFIYNRVILENRSVGGWSVVDLIKWWGEVREQVDPSIS